MDEIKKRGPGRPRKNQTPVDNEDKAHITMSEASSKKAREVIVKDQVSSVKEVNSQYITLDQIQNRWKQMFGKYGSLGYDNLMGAWGTQTAFLNNPFIQNARVKQINGPMSKLTKEEMQKAMEDPEHSEYTLTAASMGLYYTNYVYQTLVQLNRNTPMYNYYANPLYIEDESANTKKKLREDSIRVDKLLKAFDPKLTFKTISTQVATQGKCSYLVRTSYDKKDVNFLLLQKLNSDMVKIVGLGSKQQFTVSFNMVIFLRPGYDVSQYPKFIQDAWEEMTSLGVVVTDKRGNKRINPKAQLPAGHILETAVDGSYVYWVKLPQDLCYTFYSDGSHPNAFPDTIGLFNDFNSLDDYRWLQGNLLSKGITSVLTAEVPLVKDPKVGADSTAISPDTILGYTDFFGKQISENILPFFAPFTKFDLHSLQNQPESMDIIFSRVRDLIATSGNAALLPITDKPSIASVHAAEQIQASKVDYLTRQFETFLNHIINENFDLNFTWNIKLWGDIFYWRDDIKITKELVMAGAKGLIPKLLSAQEQTLEDYKGSTLYLDALDIKIEKEQDNINVNKTEQIEKNPVGRPAIAGDDVENENTGVSKDMGNNTSDIKE